MRNWIIGAAAMLAVAVPGVATAQTGYVGASYGNIDVSGGGDADFYGVEGAVAFAGSGSIVFELNAGLIDSDDFDQAYGLTGHVYSRSDAGLFGAFLGITDSDAVDETWTVGLEASKFYTNWTLAGALFYSDNDGSEAWGVNVQPRVFIHDNFRLQANLGWADYDGGGDATRFGLGGEYQFASAPISIGAGWSTIDSNGPDVDTLSIGLRYNFGGTTLRDRDRSGASQADITGTGFLF